MPKASYFQRVSAARIGRIAALLLLIAADAAMQAHAQASLPPSPSPPALSPASPNLPDRGSLHGTVQDTTGGTVVEFAVMLTAADGRPAALLRLQEPGLFGAVALRPGKYNLQVTAEGFRPFRRQVTVVVGQDLRADVTLELEAQQVQVTVTADSGATLDAAPANNASALVIAGKALDALPDDPDLLAADLQALGGLAAGPDGGQMYIDGFTAGELPPKSAIREIRINQNPFSAQYDRVGQGRVEIFTKPGGEKWHGDVSLDGNAPWLDAKNPFSIDRPDYESTQWNGDLNGSFGAKTSFSFDGQYRQVHFPSVVNAFTLAGGVPVPLHQVALNPWNVTVLRPQIQYQLTPKDTLTLRYQFFRVNDPNNGIGGLNAASQGFNALRVQHTMQVSDTHIFNEKIVHEIRFQFLDTTATQTPLSAIPSISVLGALSGGGNNNGLQNDRSHQYELVDRTSITFGRHLVKFGARLRASTDSNRSAAGFNGLFTFPTLAAYANSQPSQFTFTVGSPLASVAMVDAGLYVEDDWRIRPNLTLSYGMRFETQNHIRDHADWAPRLGVAWGLGRGPNPPKTVLRGGAGIFYSRFPGNLVLQAERLNPGNPLQQVFILNQPGFFCPNSLADCPPLSTLESEASSTPTFYRIAPDLHAPYIAQESASVERQINKAMNFSASYTLSQGFDQLLTNNVNAPLPGTFTVPNPDQSGTRPNGIAENIYEFESRGIFRQRQLTGNFIWRGSRVSFNANYTLNYAKSNTSGATNFPSNPYNISLDYSRAAFDVRHRLYLEGSATLPKGFVLSPFLATSSGIPYSVTLGQDLLGTSIFNQRPAFASSLSNPANVVVTPLGSFDTVPQPGEKLVPINFFTGTPQITLNLKLSKSFAFGPLQAPDPAAGAAPGSAAKRYSMTFSVNARNIFNIVNLAKPIGNLGSPLFGQANTISGGVFSGAGVNRQIFLGMSFGF